MNDPGRQTRLSLVMLMALVAGGCASERYTRAVQQTSIGGGLIAFGATAAGVSTAVGAGLVAVDSDIAGELDLRSAPGALVAVGVSACVAAVGFAVLHGAEADLAIALHPLPSLPSSSPPLPPPAFGSATRPR